MVSSRPERRQAFIELVQQLNGHSLPTDRPFIVPADVVFPSHLHWERQRDGSEIPRMMDGHDAGSLDNWRTGLTRAQYWFQPGPQRDRAPLHRPRPQ